MEMGEKERKGWRTLCEKMVGEGGEEGEGSKSQLGLGQVGR